MCVSRAAYSAIHKLLAKKHLTHTQLTWPGAAGLVGAEQRRCCWSQELLGGSRTRTADASSLPSCPEAGRTACNLDAVGTQPGAPQEGESSSSHRVGFRVFLEHVSLKEKHRAGTELALGVVTVLSTRRETPPANSAVVPRTPSSAPSFTHASEACSHTHTRGLWRR